MNDAWYEAMGVALDAAVGAASTGDVPVGAVVLDPEGAVLAVAGNRREADSDPTAHAEIVAIRVAAASRENWHLDGCTLVVTLEPCAMCAGAAVQARLRRIVYGAADLRAGAVWSLFNIPQDERLNHHCEVISGVRDDECGALLRNFFARKRPPT